ncbi:hypothetical protein IMG5_060550 [Ichthyophthirius multifiliis]|uniref:Uncharacterized protein n=1 Tax=Ichthyophthirius multifiliis TaxID=5932 RepID=G0QNP3_ICHMU|nr:hypothetical protein IMG5_060550 [Ichthyophthirius multifiliis]EGR33162.1 hypothetical protein IMG5_060550 [Ichthyophthirius multifiliis]|eukprot:XP_004037148.1 hypothetical protein IMG5_060550 [Ichthyophthirius multifiliis]
MEKQFEKTGHNPEKFQEYIELEDQSGFYLEENPQKIYYYNKYGGWKDEIDNKTYYYTKDGLPLIDNILSDIDEQIIYINDQEIAQIEQNDELLDEFETEKDDDEDQDQDQNDNDLDEREMFAFFANQNMIKLWNLLFEKQLLKFVENII